MITFNSRKDVDTNVEAAKIMFQSMKDVELNLYFTRIKKNWLWTRFSFFSPAYIYIYIKIILH